MTSFKPCDHRVLVGLLDDMFVCPFVVLGVVDVKGLIVGAQRVIEII
jgi:hypothetical protein